jgi:hypothetical protein
VCCLVTCFCLVNYEIFDIISLCIHFLLHRKAHVCPFSL